MNFPLSKSLLLLLLCRPTGGSELRCTTSSFTVLRERRPEVFNLLFLGLTRTRQPRSLSLLFLLPLSPLSSLSFCEGTEKGTTTTRLGIGSEPHSGGGKSREASESIVLSDFPLSPSSLLLFSRSRPILHQAQLLACNRPEATAAYFALCIA